MIGHFSAVAGSKVYFILNDNTGKPTLYQIDSADDSVGPVASLAAVEIDEQSLRVDGSTLYVMGDSTNTNNYTEVYRVIDGFGAEMITTTTSAVAQLEVEHTGNSNLTVLYYMTGDQKITRYEKTTGNAPVVTVVATDTVSYGDYVTIGENPFYYRFRTMAVDSVNHFLYYIGDNDADMAQVRKIFKYNAQNLSTAMSSNVNNGADDEITELVVNNQTLYYTAYDASNQWYYVHYLQSNSANGMVNGTTVSSTVTGQTLTALNSYRYDKTDASIEHFFVYDQLGSHMSYSATTGNITNSNLPTGILGNFAYAPIGVTKGHLFVYDGDASATAPLYDFDGTNLTLVSANVAGAFRCFQVLYNPGSAKFVLSCTTGIYTWNNTGAPVKVMDLGGDASFCVENNNCWLPMYQVGSTIFYQDYSASNQPGIRKFNIGDGAATVIAADGPGPVTSDIVAGSTRLYYMVNNEVYKHEAGVTTKISTSPAILYGEGNGYAFFQYFDGTNYNFYIYDGSTFAVADNGGDADFFKNPWEFVNYNGKSYFITNWGGNFLEFNPSNQHFTKIDLGSGITPSWMFNGPDALYFVKGGGGTNTKIYKWDGTNTIQVSNVNPAGGDHIDFYQWYNGSLYYTASPTNSGQRMNFYKYTP